LRAKTARTAHLGEDIVRHVDEGLERFLILVLLLDLGLLARSCTRSSHVSRVAAGLSAGEGAHTGLILVLLVFFHLAQELFIFLDLLRHHERVVVGHGELFVVRQIEKRSWLLLFDCRGVKSQSVVSVALEDLLTSRWATYCHRKRLWQEEKERRTVDGRIERASDKLPSFAALLL
jgi:hypothetical protein